MGLAFAGAGSFESEDFAEFSCDWTGSAENEKANPKTSRIIAILPGIVTPVCKIVVLTQA
jgi:hypothetical protein